MTIIHFFTPFIVNFLSAILIIIRIAQRRLIAKEKKLCVEEQESKLKQQQLAIEIKRVYRELIYQQIRKHKHILITPILILLALPRLIISFLFDCMKSQRDPWLFLIGYLVSFVPPIVHFSSLFSHLKHTKNNFPKLFCVFNDNFIDINFQTKITIMFIYNDIRYFKLRTYIYHCWKK